MSFWKPINQKEKQVGGMSSFQYLVIKFLNFPNEIYERQSWFLSFTSNSVENRPREFKRRTLQNG